MNGQPRTAVLTLVHELAEAGVDLRHHGDVDQRAVRTANHLFGRLPLRPWGLGVADYPAATAGRPLEGRPAAPRWGAQLEPAVADRRHAVEEEQVPDALVADLAP